jgi:hypothetical protein
MYSAIQTFQQSVCSLYHNLLFNMCCFFFNPQFINLPVMQSNHSSRQWNYLHCMLISLRYLQRHCAKLHKLPGGVLPENSNLYWKLHQMWRMLFVWSIEWDMSAMPHWSIFNRCKEMPILLKYKLQLCYLHLRCNMPCLLKELFFVKYHMPPLNHIHQLYDLLKKLHQMLAVCPRLLH